MALSDAVQGSEKVSKQEAEEESVDFIGFCLKCVTEVFLQNIPHMHVVKDQEAGQSKENAGNPLRFCRNYII